MDKTVKLSSISAFFPCFNEEKNVAPLVDNLKKVLPQVAEVYEIIIINDGSSDRTGEVAEALAKKTHLVRVVHHPTNLGYGSSIRSGFEAARYDWIFFTDGDQQFDVGQLKDFIPYTGKSPAVIGYRQKRADGLLRTVNARLFKLFIDSLFRLRVKDIDCAFKLLKTDMVKSTPLHTTGAMISSELLYRLKKRGVKFVQLPVKHYPRIYGTPTGNNPKVVVKAGFEAIRLYLVMKFGLGHYR